jgi:hypothetical protein
VPSPRAWEIAQRTHARWRGGLSGYAAGWPTADCFRLRSDFTRLPQLRGMKQRFAMLATTEDTSHGGTTYSQAYGNFIRAVDLMWKGTERRAGPDPQRPQEQPVGEAEDRAVGADADRQGENGNGGESRRTGERPPCVPDVLPHGFQPDRHHAHPA